MSSTDYNATADQLAMGDTFKLERMGPEHIVAWVTDTVSNSVRYVHLGHGETIEVPTFRRIMLTRRAETCSCGVGYERCEWGCEWPDALVKLYMSH